jgi:prepilin signal peptidase PulO-like enzyme (type II secretory pathway)
MEYLPFGPFLAVSALTVLLANKYLDEMTKQLYARWLAAFGA